jgi:hypothetical protein
MTAVPGTVPGTYCVTESCEYRPRGAQGSMRVAATNWGEGGLRSVPSLCIYYQRFTAGFANEISFTIIHCISSSSKKQNFSRIWLITSG